MKPENEARPSPENKGEEDLRSLAGESARWEETRKDSARQEEQMALLRDKHRKKSVLVLQWAFVVIAFSLALPAVAQLYKMTEARKEMRRGTYHTNQVADACIHRLWLVSRNIADGSPNPVMGMACPESGKPYAAEMTEDGMVIRCPNPRAHELSLLQVSAANPVPEVKR